MIVVFCGETINISARRCPLIVLGSGNAMNASDRKAYWDLVETLHWITTRDEGRLTLVGDFKEENRTPQAMFASDAIVDWHQLLFLVKYDFKGSREPFAWQADRKPLDADESSILGLGQSLNYLLQQALRRRICMEAIKCDRYRVKRVPVSPADLNDLEFRINLNHRVAKVGLWSRSRNALIWRSPRFLRADIIRVWPARKNKLAAVSEIILPQLQTIMPPAARLTGTDAQRRCLAEVRDAYPEDLQEGLSDFGSLL
jgi:hypothetical protein